MSGRRQERSGSDVAREAGRGFAWAGVAVAVVRLLGFVGIAVLARLLSPEDFGLVAFALAVIVYIEAAGDLGTGAALVYWPDRRDDAARVTFWTNAALGLTWAALGWLAAPALAAFFAAPEALPVVRAMMLVVPIRFLGNTPDALLRRDLRFRERLLPEVGGSATKLCVSVGAALAGAGVWSLVAGQLAGQTVTTALFWRAVPWRPDGGFPRDMAAPMLRYGSGLVTVNLLAAVTHHFDLIAVGKVLGATVLGLYQIAGKVPEVTILVLVWVVGQVLFPTFARLHAAGEALGPVYLRALRYLAAAVLPAGVGLALIAHSLVPMVFGSRWAAAAPILQGLAAYATIRALGSHAGDVLKGTGRTGLLAALGVLKVAVLVPGLLASARIGAVAVAWCLAAVAVAGGLVNVAIAARIAGFRLTAAAHAVAPAAAATLPMAVWVAAATRWPASETPAGLAAVIAVAVLIYVLALRLTDRDLTEELLRAARRGSRGPTPRPEASPEEALP